MISPALSSSIASGSGGRPRSSQESISGLPRPAPACKSGTITTSNSSPFDLWMVINCTPQSLPAAGSGRALRLSRAASSAGPSRSCSPCGKIVETAPQQIEIGARRGVDAVRSAQTQPDLLEPGSQRSRGLRRSAGARRMQWLAARARRRGGLLRSEAARARRAVPAPDGRAAPRHRRWRECADRRARGRTTARAERPARPRGPAGLSSARARARASIISGRSCKLFKFDGAEGNFRLAQRLRDGRERLCACGRARRCGISLSPRGPVRSRDHMAADQRDDFFGLLFAAPLRVAPRSPLFARRRSRANSRASICGMNSRCSCMRGDGSATRCGPGCAESSRAGERSA